MTYVESKTERGIQRTSNGWIVIEVTLKRDDDGLSGFQKVKQKLIAGPFSGMGAKVRAIGAAGTNTIIE